MENSLHEVLWRMQVTFYIGQHQLYNEIFIIGYSTSIAQRYKGQCFCDKQRVIMLVEAGCVQQPETLGSHMLE